MPLLSDAFDGYLVAFLQWSSVVLLLLFVFVLVRRGVDEVRYRRRLALTSRYRPLVTAILMGRASEARETGLAVLRAAPARHAALIGDLLIAPARVAHGATVDIARAACDTLGFTRRWEGHLDARAWWKRADATRALGLLQVAGASQAIVARLDDPHEEVRAAAVDALGHLRDPATVAALVARLPDATRHQSTRVIEALRGFGPEITPALLAYAQAHEAQLAMVADLVGFTGAAGAVSELMAWASDERTEVRTAALRALGSIGLDDRSYYYALRGLADDEAAVRAMAARALGRSRRGDAAPYLAARLDDEWIVAAHAATSLRALGDAGRTQLALRKDEEGLPGLLARQMLWERRGRHENRLRLAAPAVRAVRPALFPDTQLAVPAVLVRRLHQAAEPPAPLDGA